ncbi:RAVE protein 1 C terminal-domain-containing protein [Amanita rubescens]|nr:RAVE protein 1 C terminal-domain-containing protein [Amanita rubescens]
MLQLAHNYAAAPPAALHFLPSLLLYPSRDAVIVLDAHNLALLRVLPFHQAFPATTHSYSPISCIAVDVGMKLIIAAMASRVAAWCPSTNDKSSWRVHSTLVLSEGATVTALASRSGLLAVGCQNGLSVYSLILDNDLPTWSPKWTVSTNTPALIRYCPTLQFIATSSNADNTVRLYSTTSGRVIQSIRHPRPVINISWRHSQASSRDDLILYTITSDATLRIFMPVLDRPMHLQLHASLDIFSCVPFSELANASDSAIFWLDRETINHLEQGWDLFLRTLADGSIVVTAVATSNSDTAIYSATSSSIHSSPTTVTFQPLSFFDAQSDSFRLNNRLLDRVPDEESDIVRFVRTPEGRGVAAIRTNGGGDVWTITEHEAELRRTGHWCAAEFVVVLDEGRSFAAYSKVKGTLTLHASQSHTISLPPLMSLFSLPSQSRHENIFAITPDFTIIQVRVEGGRELFIHSISQLPLSSPPQKILPVDPMSWSSNQGTTSKHDVLLSLSSTGELEFWVPEEDEAQPWRRTGKTALTVPVKDGEELTIWDSQESEFASGLEYRCTYDEKVNDLDWTSTPDQQSILAVGFLYHVDLLCQQRMTYFDPGPGWALCYKIEIGSIIPYPINDSIWLTNGSFIIGAGHHLCLFGPTEPSKSLFEYAARQNGPLEDYHPQMLLQCLLWGKVELVKEIIENLAHDVRNYEKEGSTWHWTPLPVEKFYESDGIRPMQNGITLRKNYTSLFNGKDEQDIAEDVFSRPLVTRLIDTLENRPIPHLTPNEQAHLLVLLQTTLEIEEQRRALDANGLRFLISTRSFYILNRRALAPASPKTKGAVPRRTERRERLRFRDMVWAFHSESQGLLLDAIVTTCKGKLLWSDARALGIPLWLNSTDELKTQVENIARNEYLAGDNRDPIACSLFYFALGKVKLVHGLWRQAAWHKEQSVMLKFLSNDFSQPRWRTAALKNAYALLAKQRFEYAAAFFLLGNSLRDAVNVCIRNLEDFQLAITLARVVEQSNEGPVFLDIVKNNVLPAAFTNGNRWLASWAFWLLYRRDLAVRVLLTPLQDIVAAYDIKVGEIGEPHYDDPSLALLFSQLRSKTLQAAKGTSEISSRSEFNFVLQIARVFCRMGCHALALDLVRSWSFERPQASSSIMQVPPSPKASRSVFALEHAFRHRPSILIDMSVSSPPTPVLVDRPSKAVEDSADLLARKTGIGNLMRAAKKDVEIPDFDMNAFSMLS